MSITAKELAKQLKISEAAVSMALNNKPGVSTQTRKRVMEAARNAGYDFSKIKSYGQLLQNYGTLNFVVYRKSGALVPHLSTQSDSSSDIPFFAQLSEGIASGCKKNNYFLSVNYLYEGDDISTILKDWQRAGIKGILLLGTEMNRQDISPFISCGIPLLLIDNCFEDLNINSVTINNTQGAYLAAEYLLRKKHSQPGYLRSSYRILGFEERADGFYKSIRKNGMSASRTITHSLTPSIEGAYSDMQEILQNHDSLAECYFADNDLIAAGAMRALLEAGYRIPQDISIIGFDDSPICKYVTPQLTTVHVPKQYMGELSVQRLNEVITNPSTCPVKIEINTTIEKRKSV